MKLAHERLGPAGAPVLVLLHGIGGGRHIWRHNQAVLADAGFDVIAFDLPGYGGSVSIPPCGVDGMADAVADALAAVGVAHAAVLGHSMGGMVALALVARAPERVRALVLACSSPAFGRPDGDWQAGFVRDRLAPLDGGLGMQALAATLVPRMVAPGAAAPAVAEAQAVMGAVPEATYRAVLAAIVGFDRRAGLPAIGVPTLCLAGSLDTTAPPEVMQRMAARIPGARFEQIEGAGHLANLECPEAFNQRVADFLREACRP
jgi:3-oxoadipate enol-lactonase